MKNYPHPIIAREGWPIIAAVVLLAVTPFLRKLMGKIR